MSPVPPETLIQQLEWRYATKKFDPQKKIPAQEWGTLEKALILTASSYGLQPWRFFVVTEPTVRAKLRAAAWNQPQVTDASHLVVFAIKKPLTAKDVEQFIARVAEVRVRAAGIARGV